MDKIISKYGIGYGEKSGTWNTYDNGKTWTFISDKIQEQASIGATTVSLNDDGVYCSIEGEAVNSLTQMFLTLWNTGKVNNENFLNSVI